ncbi:hypothetical protein [Microvirga subterranea]|uniref:Uncharacterized protein n=1 Tax=Microvirga subterranea TaxID=186651 RepID=A0A370HQP9_9HYPH|nr:hypothetical protein [Microvirga subterranea]RDI60873.1 hypothetical protein DES45_102261 [Microvirga subterranea]
MKIKDQWPAITFVVAIVVLTLIILITDANAWCGSDPAPACARNWVSSVGTVIVAIAAACFAYGQWQASSRQVYLPRLERKLQIALEVKAIIVSHLASLGRFKDLFDRMIVYSEETNLKEINYGLVYATRDLCETVVKNRDSLSKIHIDEVDRELQSTIIHVYSMILDNTDDLIELRVYTNALIDNKDGNAASNNKSFIDHMSAISPKINVFVGKIDGYKKILRMEGYKVTTIIQNIHSEIRGK